MSSGLLDSSFSRNLINLMAFLTSSMASNTSFEIVITFVLQFDRVILLNFLELLISRSS